MMSITKETIDSSNNDDNYNNDATLMAVTEKDIIGSNNNNINYAIGDNKPFGNLGGWSLGWKRLFGGVDGGGGSVATIGERRGGLFCEGVCWGRFIDIVLLFLKSDVSQRSDNLKITTMRSISTTISIPFTLFPLHNLVMS